MSRFIRVTRVLAALAIVVSTLTFSVTAASACGGTARPEPARAALPAARARTKARLARRMVICISFWGYEGAVSGGTRAPSQQIQGHRNP